MVWSRYLAAVCMLGVAAAFLPPPRPVIQRTCFRTAGQGTVLEEAPAQRVEDASVPEGHRGLHDFLYGDDEDHGASAAGAGEGLSFSRQDSHGVGEWLGQHRASKVAAVYAVSDADGAVKYVGVTRNVALALEGHLAAKGPEAAASVRLQSFRYPRREEMFAYRVAWIEEITYVPEGNQGEGNGWAATVAEVASSGGPVNPEYQDVKAKLRVAMADPALADEMDKLEQRDPDRAAKLRKAVEGDDWSAAISEQTSQTIAARADGAPTSTAGAGAGAGASSVVSPFDSRPSGADGGSSGGGGSSAPPPSGPPKTVLPSGEEAMDLTPDNVDKVLEEVRPYLISDGGNIEVVRVDVATRDIFLRLQGACGSCPSSTVTMKMGVERVLREKFGQLGKVEAINDIAELSAGDADALRTLVEGKVNEIMPAIRGLGGAVAVEEVTSSGAVVIQFKGPEKVKLGLVYAVKSLSGVTNVDVKAMA